MHFGIRRSAVAVTLLACGPLACGDSGPDAAPPPAEDAGASDATPAVPDAGAEAGLGLLLRAPPCGEAKTREVLEAATQATPEVSLDCSLTLSGPSAIVTKRVILEGSAASGVTLDCQGGAVKPAFPSPPTIMVRSIARGDGTWDRPERVTVKRCTIHGSARVAGMGINGQAIPVRDSSRSAGHTERAQAAAPTGVVFSQVQIVGAGSIPLYLAPGTTGSRLVDSEISGTGNSVAVYLDAESARNVISGNRFRFESSARELLAVDGSADNRIVKNRFETPTYGGIYLYRNCGEGGTVRHQSPTGNAIVANVFVYDGAKNTNPAVWVASRNGFRLYCGEDAGYPFGSSASDLDFARNNVLAENQVVKLPVNDMLRIDDEPNLLEGNESVEADHPVVPGCVVASPQDGRPVYVKDGASSGAWRCSNGTAWPL